MEPLMLQACDFYLDLRMWFQKNNNAFNLNDKQQIVYTWDMTWRWIEQLNVNPTGQFKNSLWEGSLAGRVNWFESF